MNIFHASLLSGVVADDWKVGRIIPVFKKGDQALFCNYLPISLTSYCCKFLEHIRADSSISVLNNNNLFSGCQHGFRKDFSTVTQLTSIVHDLASILYKRGQVDVIFLDFQKAFDFVSDVHLLHKLKVIGLPAFITN